MAKKKDEKVEETAEVATEEVVEEKSDAKAEEKTDKKAESPKKEEKAPAVEESDEEEATEQKGRKRNEKVGIVYSDKMTNTVVVRVNRMVKHQLYHKYMKKRKKFMAHDEMGAAVGDRVRIVETRPLSAKKRWRVVEILQKAVK